MTTVEECKRYAADLVRLAQQTDNPNDKALLLHMAEAWLRRGEQIGKADKKDQPD